MGILDGIVGWIAEQVMNILDMISSSVLGALGCDMATFLKYFPAAETMYHIFIALAIGLILLNWVWQLFKIFGLPMGIESENPVRLSLRCVLNPNSITDVNYSIEIGIKYLADCIKQAGCTSPSDMTKLSLALQGYNYGNGYIGWRRKNTADIHRQMHRSFQI
mgnify:CR=1 FL=1